MSTAGKSKNLSAIEKRNLETVLFDDLVKAKSVPTQKNEFTKYVKNKFGKTKYPLCVIKSVWTKILNWQKVHDGNIEIIELTSSSSGDDGDNYCLTHLIDFDVPPNQNGPEYRIIKDPHISPESKSSKVKAHHKNSPRSPQKKSPIIQESKRLPKRRICEDRALLKKFRQKIILEELLRRDKKMLEIRDRKLQSVEEAVAIELEYAKRIEKERVDALAMEMLSYHYMKEGLGEPPFEGTVPNHFLSLVNPSEYIPSESVIAERLPNMDGFGEPSCSDVRDVEFSQFDIMYGTNDLMFQPFIDPIIPTNSLNKHKKKTFTANRKGAKKKVDELRDELFLDRVIELQLPEAIASRKKSRRTI